MDDTLPHNAAEALERSLTGHASRRGFLMGVAAIGAAAAGAGLLKGSAFAQSAADSAQTILNVATTAETLAVTFYSNGVSNAATLGITGDDLNYLVAAAIEEQIHLNFLLSNGGQAATTTFSFPKAATTFSDLSAFLSTQQQLEGVFDSAYTAATYEFIQLGQPALARVATQIGMVEDQHRVLGRIVAQDNNITLDSSLAMTSSPTPENNWGFAPQLVTSVGAAVPLVQSAGYLSPASGNSYSYQAIDFTSSTYASVYSTIMYTTPFVATPTLATPVYRHHNKKHHNKKQ